MRSLRALLLLSLTLGCAEGRMTRGPDALPPDDADDAGADGAEAPADLGDFDGPRFDIPPTPDATGDAPLRKGLT